MIFSEMLGLVDYAGSDSDSDNDEKEVKQQTSIKPPAKETLTEDSFFGEEPEKVVSTGLELEKDDVLEDIVKPKDWELKLAEKTRKKLERKAKKAAKKEKKKSKKDKSKISKISGGVTKKEKGKVVISAFGALATLANDNDSDDDEDEKPLVSTKPKGLGFLANLPAPKGKDNKSGASSAPMRSLIPPSVAKRAVNHVQAAPKVDVPKFVDDSDDDDDVPSDFFGFSAAPKKNDELCDIPQMPSTSSMEMVGPSKPTTSQIHPSQMYNMADYDMEDEDDDKPIVNPNDRVITDEQAHKLLMRFSHDIGPEEKRSLNEMAASIVDVKVDDAIGPDVKSTILKNLSHRAFNEATAAPLPNVQQAGQASRRKHQITYLANLAVQKEEALKEQWADQKQSKRMARAKYGF